MSVRGALVVAAMVAIMMVLHFDEAKATNYKVGKQDDSYGWTAISYSSSYYPSGATLRTGDTLQFIYVKNIHNVVRLGKTGYENCDDSIGGWKYTTGNDTIPLRRGWNYFICTTKISNTNENMCSKYNMKIAVNAE
ncbi:hypothetical protein CASFOL_016306 [Castilleja foliolosa]|uniref:Phytocyanin domain-containing protein n=1 Tax=Castilleja foliolosa TaxID=1961234 RepID=A0ABD3DG75_9LAMI